MGHDEKMIPHSKGFFSGLFQNLPSFFHIFQVDSSEATNTSSNRSLGDTVLSSGCLSTLDLDLNTVAYPLELIPEEDEFPDMLKNLLLRKESCHDPTKGATDPVETNIVSNYNYDDQNYGEKLDIVGTIHGSHHFGPAFHVAELWAKKCFQSRAKVNDKVEISNLPVGVRASKLSPDCTSYSDHKISENSDYINQEKSSDIAADMSKKNSALSVRAAMMLTNIPWNSVFTMIVIAETRCCHPISLSSPDLVVVGQSRRCQPSPDLAVVSPYLHAVPQSRRRRPISPSSPYLCRRRPNLSSSPDLSIVARSRRSRLLSMSLPDLAIIARSRRCHSISSPSLDLVVAAKSCYQRSISPSSTITT
ncbi:hypothetical protein KSP40_PGU019911 [Platanthera guangdongensis]|uniref:Uncharacterized protein n=1 Tax=Platanthera guangdongensis TaxID=2320717 RepID=A0ABR2MAF6_9ASPA